MASPGWLRGPMSAKKIVWDHEIRFAREVALATIVSQGQPLWQTMIPGMFVIGLLKRLKTVRQVNTRYCTIRLLAMDRAGHPIARSYPQTLRSQIQKGLAAQKARVHDAEQLSTILDKMIETLAGFYRNLLQHPDASWDDMLVYTYGDLDQYLAQIEQVEQLESELSECVSCDRPEKQKLPLWTPLEQTEIHQRTIKFARMAFGKDD